MSGADGNHAHADTKAVKRSDNDPVLVALREASAEYRKVRSEHEQTRDELIHAQEQVATAEAQVAEMAAELERLRAEREAEHEQMERERARANHLSGMVNKIHRALFSGNVYEQILRSCMTLTHATRGLYVTAKGGMDRLKVRAAIDVEGYPGKRPSEWLAALCHEVLQNKQPFVWSEDDSIALPHAVLPLAERFKNCVAVPVVLMKNFDGIIIVGDKLNGAFGKEDAETLLAVGDQAAIAVENEQLRLELQHTYISTIVMLADAVEAKDPYTHGHCELVSRYARLTAQHLNLSSEDCSLICYAGLLHDVGKIAISDGILHKPGALLPEERELIRSHVRVGYDLIRNIPALERIADIVLYHHEWYDGSGYPTGADGDSIPMAARIVSVVDSYCAMVTKRSYKDAVDDRLARAELIKCAGTQFDPNIVDAFLVAIDSPEARLPVGTDEMECGILPRRQQDGDGQERAMQRGG